MRSKAVAIAIAIGVTAACAPDAQAQDWRTVTSLRQFKGEESLRVYVEYGAGRLHILPSDANALYKATLRYDAKSFRPVTQYEPGRLKVGVDGGSVKGRNMKSGRLELGLSKRVPLYMDLKFGAVQANLELGGLQIQELHIATGASETNIDVSSPNQTKCSMFELEVGAADFKAGGLGNLNCERWKVAGGVGDVTLDFNGAWSVDATADINMGLGALTLRMPRGLGVQVRKKGFLASFDSQELIKRGNTYYSENWDKATNRLSINIDAALGSIRVVWVEPKAEFKNASR